MVFARPWRDKDRTGHALIAWLKDRKKIPSSSQRHFLSQSTARATFVTAKSFKARIIF
jgi:hypothetical protein